MTTNRKKLVKLLGSAQLRDFSNDAEMKAAKTLSDLMAANDQPSPARKRTKKVDTRTDTEKVAQNIHNVKG